MALIKCKECGKDVSKQADSCPECGYSFKKEKESRDKGIGCLVMIALGVGLWFWVTSTDPGPSETKHWTERDEWSMAYVVTERHVKDRLVAPSTAKFPGVMEKRAHTSRNGQTYTIISYVDSQNRMGAMVRTPFVAEIRQAEKDQWRMITLELIE